MDHQLSPDKAETDLGVDYFCQVMTPVPGSQSIEATGAILGLK
jgi:hypothetical protein